MDETERSYKQLLDENNKLKKELKSFRNASIQLEEATSRLNALINNQDASIWSIDSNYNYIIFNDYFKNAYQNAFGVTLEKGLNSLKILTADHAVFWKEKYDIALNGKHVNFEFNNQVDNLIFTYEVVLSPVVSNNKTIGVTAVSIDITKQKNIEQNLLESNTNMVAIMENTLESIWAINTDYEILYSNNVFTSSFYNTFGVTLKKGINLLNALPESIRPIWKARYDRALNNERFSFVDEIDTGEQMIYVEVSMNPIIREEQVIGASFFANDISKRVNALKALEENEQRLKESNITKDKFFSIIAHDLKSPFNSIVGLSDLLVNESEKGKNIENIAKIIQKSSHQAMNLITNLLEWSHSQSGKLNYQPNYHEVATIVQEEFAPLESIAKQKKITINNSIPSNTIVYADRYLIGSIFRNLISNALKFTNPYGQITISSHLNKKEIYFSVTDNGVGINTEDIPKLFVIDQNYTTTGTDNESGSGLGLILCKEFAEKHNGHIWVKSEKNKGSEFCFSLPIVTI